MAKRLENALSELVSEGIISQTQADQIQAYLKSEKGDSQKRLLAIFGVMGALLVGLGIILIVAHNWDNLSKGIKTLLAFTPLVIGQAAAAYALFKQPESTGWREGAAVFTFLAIGTCISLISQIYHIPGDIGSFLLTCSLLGLPLVYVLRSSMASILYLGAITWYAAEGGYGGGLEMASYLYWGLLLLLLPHYYLLYKKEPGSNFLRFHHWLIPLSLIICLGILADHNDWIMHMAYMSLFGCFYLLGRSAFLEAQKLSSNGYLILGGLGTVVLWITLSFDWFWEEISRDSLSFIGSEGLVALILSGLAGVLLYANFKKRQLEAIDPFSIAFILFIICFFVGMVAPKFAMILTNLIIFATGLLLIREGNLRDNLGILNIGLLIITALIISRFFDTNLSFVLRGILFVAVGAGFFGANYAMIKKRKQNEA